MVTQAITPELMMMIGRAFIRDGQSVFYITTDGGSLMLLPATEYNVTGGPMPSDWSYDLTVAGPSIQQAYTDIPAESVLHFRYAADPHRPWMGNAPLRVAYLAGKLSAETIRVLADESSSAVGSLLGIPVDGDDPTVTKLKADLRTAKGNVGLIENGDWGNVGEGAVDLTPRRFGPNPPAALVSLVEQARLEVVSACGMNIALWGAGDAASVREAYRLLLFSVLSPLGKIVQTELTAKIGYGLTLTWEELRAADIQGRARSFQSIVGGGATVESAAQEVGFRYIKPKPEPTGANDAMQETGM
ncbi:MAG: hypothetical protein OXE87_01400 [Chloroflexi bacterium]|nr:hypothetical protein [Chloroflexota bacterium]